MSAFVCTRKFMLKALATGLPDSKDCNQMGSIDGRDSSIEGTNAARSLLYVSLVRE